jgi:hypothetical protein
MDSRPGRGFCVLLGVICMLMAGAGDAETCTFEMAGKERVTFAPGNSHTTRSNATCICTDEAGITHLVYEDIRSGEFEIYYGFVRNDTLSREIRITRTPGESSFPCIACGGGSTYILWQEMVGKHLQIEYARIVEGEVVARTRLTDSPTGSFGPVAAYDGDGTLHVAWHEGPFYQTGIVYGRVVDDSLVHMEQIPAESPEAFRPDLACDGEGKVLLMWLEGFNVMSRFWDGEAWQEVQAAWTGEHRTWRMSVAYIEPGRWGAAWFDRTEEPEYRVYAGFFDESRWHGKMNLNEEHIGYYPNVCAGPEGHLQVVWESKDAEAGFYSMKLRCHDGRQWQQTQDFLVGKYMIRYPSISLDPGGDLQVIWFSNGQGAYEIYRGVLRRK